MKPTIKHQKRSNVVLLRLLLLGGTGAALDRLREQPPRRLRERAQVVDAQVQRAVGLAHLFQQPLDLVILLC